MNQSSGGLHTKKYKKTLIVTVCKVNLTKQIQYITLECLRGPFTKIHLQILLRNIQVGNKLH